MRYVLPAGAVPFHALEVSLQRVDYDVEQHKDYARGRALSQDQVQVWLDAFAGVLPERRPLVGLDVGSGTGRYTPALARAFGPTTGVEPSVRMREVAQAQAWASEVGYVAGSAEALPAASESADYALLSCCWHHVQDKRQAVQELGRVLRPGGRVLLRTNFRDHHPRPWWLEHFPRGYEADAAMFQPLHEVIALFTSSGWRVTSFSTVTEPSTGTRGEMLARLRLRTLSFFAQLDPQELDVGFRRLERAVAGDPDGPAPVYSEPLLALQLPGPS